MSTFRLPDPPAAYDRSYMEHLLGQLNLQLRLMQNPGHVQGSTMNLSQLPTSAAGLRSGDVWVDTGAGDVLKLVP